VHGNLDEYLGIKINKDNAGNIHMSQSKLIDSILVNLKLLDENGKLPNNTHTKILPSMFARKIGANPNGSLFEKQWHYRTLISKLNYLKKSNQPDVLFLVHQLAQYSTMQRAS
jgi:hypothetical protein